MGGDLVEPEGVNAGSEDGDAGSRRGPATRCPAATRTQAGRTGARTARCLGAPPEPAGDADGVYGSEPPA